MNRFFVLVILATATLAAFAPAARAQPELLEKPSGNLDGRELPEWVSGLRLTRMLNCYSCGAEVSLGGQGDHIIPRVKGGLHDVSNFAPMCSKCNSKKGAKDLMEWWLETGRPLQALHEDFIVAYCRVQYRYLSNRGILESPVPSDLIRLLDSFGESLPSPQRAQPT